MDSLIIKVGACDEQVNESSVNLKLLNESSCALEWKVCFGKQSLGFHRCLQLAAKTLESKESITINNLCYLIKKRQLLFFI